MTAAGGAPVALVTGGAGGFGAAFGRALAGRGHRVLLADVDLAAAERVAAGLGGLACRLDVRDPAQNAAAVELAVREFGRLDVLALNAGVSSGRTAADPLDVEAYRRIVGTNVDGVVFGLDAALPRLRETGGSVVVTASLAGLVPMAGDPLYTLTKTAVVGYVRAMAGPLAVAGVRINALCPGFADTPILGVAMDVLAAGAFPLLTADEVAAGFLAVLDGGGSGEAWFLQPGREPGQYRFRGVPGPQVGGAPVPMPELSAWGGAPAG